MYIIAGLGNPGRKYENTRHNMGFIAVDLLAEKYGIKVDKIKFKALVGEGRIAGQKVLLVKPQTYMKGQRRHTQRHEKHRLPAGRRWISTHQSGYRQR